LSFPGPPSSTSSRRACIAGGPQDSSRCSGSRWAASFTSPPRLSGSPHSSSPRRSPSTSKYAGAAYLVFLGARRLLGRDDQADVQIEEERELGLLFRRGIVVNVLNPKTALFFFAFLPQFVDPQASAPALQIAFLGLLFIAIALISDGAYALAAGALGGWLRRSRGFVALERYVSGTVFVGLGVAAALGGSRRAA